MVEYFGGAPNAFAGGMLFSKQRRALEQRENALNALIARFGPEAADPAALTALQNAEHAAALQPHVLGEAERRTAAGEAVVSAYGPVAGDPTAMAADAAVQAQKARAGRMAATYLRAVRDRGGDLATAFDRISATLPAVGAPSETLGALRQHIISNPDSLDELMAMFDETSASSTRGLSGGVAMRNNETGELEWVIPTETGFRVIPGYTPATAEQADVRLGQGNVRLGLQARALTRQELADAGFDAPPGYQLAWAGEPGNSRIVAEPIIGSQQELEREASFAERASTLQQDILGAETTVVAPAEAIRRNGESVLEFMDESPWFKESSLWRGTGRRIVGLAPDSDVREINTMLETLKANIGFTQLSNMTRGLGAVSERELQQLERVLGALTTDRQPDMLRRDIEEVLRLHSDIVRKTEAAVERRRGQLEELQRQREARPLSGDRSEGPPDPATATIEELEAYWRNR